MKRFLLVLAVGALLAPAALAKGPSEATVTGPGLKQPLSVGGTEGSGPLGDLTQYSGFFPAAFGQSPNPMLPRKPKVRLGPRYTIRYVVPAGDGVSFRVTQYVFPYARRGAANGASAVEACVMRAGCSIRLSTPPRLSASRKTLVRAQIATASSSDSARNETIPPASRICCAASPWPGCDGRPG